MPPVDEKLAWSATAIREHCARHPCIGGIAALNRWVRTFEAARRIELLLWASAGPSVAITSIDRDQVRRDVRLLCRALKEKDTAASMWTDLGRLSAEFANRDRR
jgi:hypothetical protein